MNQEINQTTPPQQEESRFRFNDLVNRIIGFIKAPVFENDLEKTRKASILYAILLTFLVVMIVYGLIITITNKNPFASFVIVTIIIALAIVNMVLVKRGSVDLASRIFVLFMWVIIMIAGVLYGQAAFNPMLPFIFIVLAVTGSLLNNQFAISIGVVSIVYIIGFYLISPEISVPKILELSESIYVTRVLMGVIFATFLTAVTVVANNRIQTQIQQTAESLRGSNEELEEIRAYLEQEVAENTRQLERRSLYLEAGARVARASISTQNLQEMLERVAGEVSTQFGFYHVGIFLLDENKEWAALRATNSEGGRQMIARNHRLAVGAQGIVGYVTSLGQARISQDTGEDRVHEPAAELPTTRSEMALPLISRNEIIGALDIQDTQAEAFTEDDITVLQTMADQIALAIENIRLFTQTQESLEEVQRLFGDYSQQAWHNVHQKNLLTSYRYFGGEVVELEKSADVGLTENTVSIPVQVRGVNLGAIEIAKGEEGANWSDEELKLLQSLSEQLGIALDSARLFNESQLRATTEHTISEINSQLWETMDINSILRTTAENLRETLALPELTIRMASHDDETEASSNGNLETDEEVELND